MPQGGKNDKKWQGKTLPDYLQVGLDVVFVGLNPGLYSVQVGHYFAFKPNRFWSALSASGLVPESVGPEDDIRLLDWGIGLTDIVKRPTRGIHELARREFVAGAKVLQEKISRSHPHVVCFVGLTGYQICCGEKRRPGVQPGHFGGSSTFVIPSTSPRNATYSLDQIIAAMQDLKKHIQTVKDG